MLVLLLPTWRMSTLTKKCTGGEMRSPVKGMVSNKEDVMLFCTVVEQKHDWSAKKKCWATTSTAM
jgi:hypothetical protein